MKTAINISNYNLSQYDSTFQISDCQRSGLARVIGIIGENYNFNEKRWYINAETNFINHETGIHLKEFTKPTLSKGQEWLISNNYKVILTNSQGVPLVNPDFQTTEEIQIQSGVDDEGNPIYETETVSKEITYENSPFKLLGAFDRYSDFKRRLENPVSMYVILTVAISNDDAMEYFDEKENHLSVLDIVKLLYSQEP